MSAKVSTILGRKGAEVFTIRADATLGDAADELTEHGVGALVVSDDGRTIHGIVSERDLVRELARGGAGDWAARSVSGAMSSPVTSCQLDEDIERVMALMTTQRIRHVPVLDEDVLAGLVSIGDVVKWRMDELEVQAEALEQYVSGSA